jgi:hypothetical protein
MEATWVKSGKEGWNLVVEPGGVLATLERVGPEGTLARSEIAGRAWTFERTGFAQSRISIRGEGVADRPMVFRGPVDGAGTVSLAGGQALGWIPEPAIGEWAWTRAGGDRVMTIRPHRVDARGIVSFEASRPDPELLRLAALGWYLILMRADDGGATMVAAISGRDPHGGVIMRAMRGGARPMPDLAGHERL